MITVSFLICLITNGPLKCERQQLVAHGPATGCLTAQISLAQWIRANRPGWRLIRIEDCGAGRPI